jgi:hypothetical protein
MNTSRLIIALVATTRIAAADPDDTADGALKHGQAALKAGRVHEACGAFEASDKLAASVDTELLLAGCYEQDGKTMAAARLYRGVADKDTNSARRQQSIAKAAKLEAKAPKLRFAINPNPPGLVVKVDGVEVPATGDVLVDVGPHEVVATAPGYQGHASAPVDRDRAIVDVILRMEPVAETAPAPAPAAAPEATAPATATAAPAAAAAGAPAMSDEMPASSDHRKRNGIILGAGGVAMLVGSVVLWQLSSHKFDDEHALCPMSKCANDADLASANSLLSDGHTLRGVSIGMGIGGGVLIAAGAYLLLTPHARESRVAVHVGRDSAGIAYAGRF